MHPTSDSDLAWRVAAGEFDHALLERLRSGFTAFVDAAGAVPLERCLRLPRSTKKFRKMQRDRWLVDLARATEATSSWGRAVAVSEQLDAFLSRGPWRAWSDLKDPPPGTSNLRTALFYVAQFNDGRGLDPRTVLRVVGQLSK